MYRFLLSPRWLVFALVALLIAGLSVRLGFWQWHRLEHRHETNARVTKLLKQQPRDIAGFTPGPESEWTRVRATGRYLDTATLTVKFTIRAGAPGVDVVTPLRLADGSVVLVDRGWLATDNSGRRPANIPAAPTGLTTVLGWWHPDNQAGSTATVPEDGQVRAISSRALGRFVGHPLVAGFVCLTHQSPPPAAALRLAVPPDLGSGPHFFYALQWWFFAALAVVGFIWFARVEEQERRAMPAGRAPVPLQTPGHDSAST